MKRIYKIILFFVAIFLIGVFSFAGYISYSYDENEKLNASDSTDCRENEENKNTADKTFYLN